MIRKWKKKVSLLHKKLLLLKYYCTRIDWTTSTTDKKRIIICFDGLFSHGGLVDRLKGIISFYEIAKRQDYDFYIYFTHPFKLIHFLEPNSIPWEISKSQLKYNPFTTKIFYLMDNFLANPLELIEETTAKTILIYSNIDYLQTIYPDKSKVDVNTIWRQNYKELFLVSHSLQSQIDKLPQERSIVFHTRFTSLMGDFKDTTALTLDAFSQLNLMRHLVEKIQEVTILDPTVKPYVLSDSIVFLNYVKANTTFGILDGNPKHIGIKNNDQDLVSQYKTFTDFYFMTKCEVLYLLRFNPMYNSSFCKYAAIIGNVSFTTLQE